MDKSVRISVIVPVYNKEKYLPSCIDSLVKQTYKDKEIILSDDGSTDKSGLICDEYASEYDCIKVLHKENGGPSSAWKAGFEISTGEYIMFVDSDDRVDAKMLEEMAAHLSFIPRELVLSDYAITREDGSETYIFQALAPGEYDKDSIKEDIIPNLLGAENRIISYSRCMKLVERSLIADNKDYCDERVILGDDSTIMLPVLFDSERIFMMDHRVYYHYLYINDSIVHRYDENAYENNRLYYDAIKHIIEDKFKEDDERKKMMLKCLDREELLLLILMAKSEVRGNPEGCRENLRKLRVDEFASRIIDNVRIKLTDKANILVYRVLKNPSRFNIGLLKAAFAVYYRK